MPLTITKEPGGIPQGWKFADEPEQLQLIPPDTGDVSISAPDTSDGQLQLIPPETQEPVPGHFPAQNNPWTIGKPNFQGEPPIVSAMKRGLFGSIPVIPAPQTPGFVPLSPDEQNNLRIARRAIIDNPDEDINKRMDAIVEDAKDWPPKDQIIGKADVGTIGMPPVPSWMDREKQFFQKMTEISPEKAQVVNHLALVFNIEPTQAAKHFDELTRELYPNRAPTGRELITGTAGLAMQVAIVSGLVTNPIGTLVGLGTFMGAGELENAAISKITKQQYKILGGKGLKDLAPNEINEFSKTALDTIDFLGQALIGGGGYRLANKAFNPLLNSDWWAHLTKRERGLTILDMKQKVDGGMSEGEVIRQTMQNMTPEAKAKLMEEQIAKRGTVQEPVPVVPETPIKAPETPLAETTPPGEIVPQEEAGKAEKGIPGIEIKDIPYIKNGWETTPVDMRESWDELSNHVDEVKAQNKPRIEEIETELENLKGVRDADSRIKKKALKEELDDLKTIPPYLLSIYESKATDEQIAVVDEARKKALKEGVSEDQIDDFVQEFASGISQERPYIEYNYEKSIQQIYDEILPEFLPEQKPLPAEEAPKTVQEKPVEGAKKEPWEMTKKEWVNSEQNMKEYIDVIKNPPFAGENTAERSYGILNASKEDAIRTGGIMHKVIVKDALKEGKPVPPEVLAEYPDLKPVSGEPPAQGVPGTGGLVEEARKYKNADEFVKSFPEYPKGGYKDVITYMSDKTPLGEGIKLHEAMELKIYRKTPSAGSGKLPAGHTEALQIEIGYYKKLVPELNKYPDIEIDKVVVGRLEEKYGKGIYGNELSAPIPFKAKMPIQKEIYNLVVNNLEKQKPIPYKSQLTDIYNSAVAQPELPPGITPAVDTHIRAKVQKLGSLARVKEFYSGKTPVAEHANKIAEEMYGAQNKTSVQKTSVQKTSTDELKGTAGKPAWDMSAGEYLQNEPKSTAKGAAVIQMASLIKEGKSLNEAAAHAMDMMWAKNPHRVTVESAAAQGNFGAGIRDYPDLMKKYGVGETTAETEITTTALPNHIEKSISKIEILDKKIKPLEQNADNILRSSGVGQAPPVYHQTLDKIIKLKEKQAEIWNEELRNKLFNGKTLWQRAIASNSLVIKSFGKENMLNFSGEDIRTLLKTPDIAKPPIVPAPKGKIETKGKPQGGFIYTFKGKTVIPSYRINEIDTPALEACLGSGTKLQGGRKLGEIHDLFDNILIRSKDNPMPHKPYNEKEWANEDEIVRRYATTLQEYHGQHYYSDAETARRTHEEAPDISFSDVLDEAKKELQWLYDTRKLSIEEARKQKHEIALTGMTTEQQIEREESWKETENELKAKGFTDEEIDRITEAGTGWEVTANDIQRAKSEIKGALSDISKETTYTEQEVKDTFDEWEAITTLKTPTEIVGSRTIPADHTTSLTDLTDARTKETIAAGTPHYVLKDTGETVSEKTYANMTKGVEQGGLGITGVKETKGKEPWQMTRDEWANSEQNMKEYIDVIKNPPFAGADTAERSYGILNASKEEAIRTGEKMHKSMVRDALKENKPVPDAVLREYPDLFEKYGKKPDVIPPEDKQTSFMNGEYGLTGQGEIRFYTKRGDQTETPEFKKWFGNSKVVDAKGKPLVVYHGTSTPTFNKFQKSESPSGFWFTSNNDVVKKFANKRFAGIEPGIYDVFLSIENPKEYNGWEQYRDAATNIRSDFRRAQKSLNRKLINEGYDGIIIRNSTTDTNIVRDDYIAFSPTQIKSATGNTGAFSPTNPDIRYQTAKPTAPKSSPAEIRSALDELQTKFGFRVEPVDTIEQFPEDMRDQARQAQTGGNLVLGMYHEGKAWIAMKNISSVGELQRVFIHEAIHYGLRKVKGGAFNDFLDYLATSTRYAEQIKMYAKLNDHVDLRVAADEWFAEKAEGMKENSTLWQRFVFTFRKWLRGMGIKWESLKWGKPELVELLQASRDAARRGGEITGTEIGEAPVRFIISPETAKNIDIKTKLPKDEIFTKAVENTEGAKITKEGLLIKVKRQQNPDQGQRISIRTRVFYQPFGSLNKFSYLGKHGYGGNEIIQGETLVRRPLFVKGATGGKAPQMAYDSIKGKGAYDKMRSDVIQNMPSPYRISKMTTGDILDKYGADPDLEYEIESVSKKSGENNFAYAIQENIVAHAVREAGYDSVLGYSTKKDGTPFLSELFDVREITYLDQFKPEGKIHSAFSPTNPDIRYAKKQTRNNAYIAKILNKIADDYDTKGEVFKSRAYRKAARTVSNQTKNLVDMIATGEPLKSLPGIGKNLEKHIQEIVTTGTTPLHEKIISEEQTKLKQNAATIQEGADYAARPSIFRTLVDFPRPLSNRIADQGIAGKELSKTLLHARDVGKREAGKRMVKLKDSGFMGLDKDQRINLLDVLEGVADPASPEIEKAFNTFRNLGIAEETKSLDVQVREQKTVLPEDSFPEGYKPTRGQQERHDAGQKVAISYKRPFKERQNFYPHIIPSPEKLKSGKIREDVVKNMVRSGEALNENDAVAMIESYRAFIDTGKRSDVLEKYLVESGQAKDVNEANMLLSRFRKRHINRQGSLEYSRVADLPFYDPDPLRTIPPWTFNASMRLSQIREFGQNNEVINKLIRDIDKNQGNAEYVRSRVDRILGIVNEPDTGLAKLSRALRVWQGFKLGLSSLQNITQPINAYLATDAQSAFVGLKSLFTKEGRRFGMESGATLEQTINQMVHYSGGDFRPLNWFLKLTGFTPSEFSNRTQAANTGKFYVNKMLNRLKKNPKDGLARKKITEMGLNPDTLLKQGKLTDDDVLLAGNKMSDLTQFSADPLELPDFASTSTGKVFFQFKQYIYGQTRLIYRESIEEFAQGRIGRGVRALLILAVVFPMTGEVVQDIRSMITGRKRPTGALARYFEDIAATGATGLLSSLISSGVYGNVASFLFGPTAGEIIDVTEKTTRDVQRFSKEKNRQKGITDEIKHSALLKMAFRDIPLFGQVFVNRVFPPKGQKKSSDNSNASWTPVPPYKLQPIGTGEKLMPMGTHPLQPMKIDTKK